MTGVYAFESGPPPSFRVLLRSAGDVELLAAAPWWTYRHTLVLLVATAVTGIVGLGWIRMIANRNALAQEHYRAIIAERSRLATELHDTLEQGLAGIQLQLGAVARTLDTSPPTARRALGTATEMLRYSLSEARRSVMDLRHGALETRDLGGALSELAEQMTTGTSLSATVRMVGSTRSLERSAEHHLLRIGLEALTNAVKHSGATLVDVELRFDDDTVHLVVRDNGTGFAETGLDGTRRAFWPARYPGSCRQARWNADAREPRVRRRDCRRQCAVAQSRTARARLAASWSVASDDDHHAKELRLMLVDDHSLVRVGLSSVIGLEPDMTVCAEAATGSHAIELFRSTRPDVTLMDLRLPDLSGTDAIRSIRAEFADAKIIALSTFAGDEEIHMALEAGALAYLVKTVQPEELVETIRKVSEGRQHVPRGSGGAVGAAIAAVPPLAARARSAEAHGDG